MQPIKDIINNFLNAFLGKGKNQNINNPVRDHRKPLSKIGGNCSIAGFAITKPNPHKQGTSKARRVSFIGTLSTNKLFKYYRKLHQLIFLNLKQ